ncbi:hypothetical protein SteCoe_6599 [Stentor coeruleus]|uniref:Alcohol dehydrogenase-like C-terminal domain-containing protein n=1 Tax=Stentor coeruleus TaxID=5963 RepID=A0A1R2CPM4_9CILI|nr:hypothetical protein SteCoe_6599 [Stentor coeruleus]
MKALAVSEKHECFLDTIPIPILGDNQVLIKTVCAPIHRLDIQNMRGALGKFSGIPGHEGAGLVVKTGSSFKSQKLKGKKVCFFKKSGKGAWSEYVISDLADCCIINEEFGFIKASTLMLVPLTMVMIGKLIKKKKLTCIISTLASSTLGKMLQRWCNSKDVTCINIVRTEDKAQELISLGAKYVVSTCKSNYLSELKNICLKLKPKCCFDGLGGEITQNVFSLLENQGCVYVYSSVCENEFWNVNGNDITMQRKKVKGLWMLDWYKDLTERKKQKYFKKIQKRQHIFRTDNFTVIPVIDVLPELNDYVSEYPPGKIIMDFSELARNTLNVMSPLPSPKTSLTSSIKDFRELNSPSSSESEQDLAEIAQAYVPPGVNSLLSSLPPVDNPVEGSVYFLFNDSSVYFGPLKDKRPEGYCTIYYPNGDVYQGYYDFTGRKGKGRIIYNNSDWFEGSWKEDIPAGAGVYHFSDERSIQGNFLQSEVLGTGIETCPNGDKYEGSFNNKKRNGKGILTSKDWRYEGKFRNGEIFGPGVVRFNDGKEFVGEFNGNVGVGLLKYADLTYYEGKIVDFLEDGEGEIVNKDGIRKKGRWEMGKLKSYAEEEEHIARVSSTVEENLTGYEGIAVEITGIDDFIPIMIIK